MTDVFREVDEDLRREQLKQIWKRYGTWIIAAAGLVVVIVAVFVLLESLRTSRENAEGDRYMEAVRLLQAGEPEAAGRIFDEIVADGLGGYPILARMVLGTAKADMGDVAGAVAEFDAVAANEDADPIIRDAARFHAAYAMIDTAPMTEIDLRLQPLLLSGSPFRYLAMELMVVAAIRLDDLATASNWLTILSMDPNIPETITQRLQILSAIVASRPGPVTEAPAAPAAPAGAEILAAPPAEPLNPLAPTPTVPGFVRPQATTPTTPQQPTMLPPLDFGLPLTLP